jgi:hypothetical protein
VRLQKPDRVRALEFIAACHDHCTEAILRANGFALAGMVELVRAGLTSATAGRVDAGAGAVEVNHLVLPTYTKRTRKQTDATCLPLHRHSPLAVDFIGWGLRPGTNVVGLFN